jgi:GR25 family glycosyltransferase involved in LPS biosynthesis
LFMMFPIYVISVKTYADRHRHIALLAERYGLEVEFVWPFDVDDLSASDLSGVSDKLAPASVSNVLKHLHAQEMLLQTDKSFALILEDDVILFDDFLEKMAKVLKLSSELEPGWLIFLGGADNKIDSRFIEADELTLISAPLTTAEAYLVDRTSCAKRCEWLRHNKVDRQADHQLKLIDNLLQINQYCVSHPMATQGSVTGLFDTKLDSSRSKHGSTYLRLRYAYNRFRRQVVPRFWARFKKRVIG